jgi:hypothetical protein
MSFLSRAASVLFLISAVYPVSLDRWGFALSTVLLLVIGAGWVARSWWSRRGGFSLPKINIWQVLLLALALRVLLLALADLTQISDYGDFDRIALSVSQGGAWFDPGRPPGISWIAALCYYFFGVHLLVPLAANLFLQLLSIYVVWRAARIFFGERIAVGSALLLAFYPEHIIHANYLCSEPGYFLGVNLGFLLYASAIFIHRRDAETQRGFFKNGNPLRLCVSAVGLSFLAGMSFAAAQYFRSTAPIALGAVFLVEMIFFWREKGRETRLPMLRLSALAVAFLLGISPIIWHNRQNLGIWNTSSYQMGGWSMYLATNPEYLGNWNEKDVAFFDSLVAVHPPPPGQNAFVYRDSLAKELAFERFAAHPVTYFAAMLFYKPFCLWGDPSGAFWVNQQFEAGTIGRAVFGLWLILYHKFILLMASLALWRFRWESNFWQDAWLVFAWLNTLAFSILGTEGRYHNVLLGWLCCWAAWLISSQRRSGAAG